MDVWNKNESRLANNVIRKIAELKVAGALNKTGKKHAALKIYAKYGDVGSIRTLNYGKISNELEFVYNLQPNSPYIPDELQNWLIFLDNNDTIDKNDTIYNGRFMYDNIRNIIKVANKAVRNKKTKNKAMWYYTLAALYDRKGENHKALSFLKMRTMSKSCLQILNGLCQRWKMKNRKTSKRNLCRTTLLTSEVIKIAPILTIGMMP